MRPLSAPGQEEKLTDVNRTGKPAPTGAAHMTPVNIGIRGGK